MPAVDRLGKYEIRRTLGRGAMGIVYEAYDPMIKRRVALKTIRGDQLGGDDAHEALARFRREAQAAGRLNHPNIVAIYDYDEDDGTSFIAMEYVEGRDLKSMFEGNERFGHADVVRIMAQLLDALGYSHRQGVVHRDVKPGNVFLQDDGTVKVADFGIAHIDASSLTQVGSVMGTPSYMSPEQIQGLPVDGRSDLFSAGVILYQFLTGERPFGGSSATTMQKVLKQDPLPPSTLNVTLPEAVDAVVRKALAKRPEARYQSAKEFADALGAALAPPPARAVVRPAVAADPDATVLRGGDATVARGSEPTIVARSAETGPATGSPVADASVPPAAAATPAKRPQTTAIAVVVVAVAAAAAAAWHFLGREADKAAAVASVAAVPAAMPPAAAPVAPGPAPASTPAASVPPVTLAAPAGTTAMAPAAPVPPATDPGKLVITALGVADPAEPRFANDPAALQGRLRADAKGQLVEKALGLLVDRASVARNYATIDAKLLADSGRFIGAVVEESAPQLGRDGLMTMTTQAVVDVRAVQKSLNQLTREERIDLIRAGGDPKIAVRIATRDADRPDAPGRSSPVAENLVKERIKSFGFRTWSEGGSDAAAGADFTITGEAAIKRLSMRLEASGLVVTKYALTSWTVKCVDRATGEEIYFNTTLPKGVGSFASEEEALRAIGTRIADAFSRDFFLQHVASTGQNVTLAIEGLPDDATAARLARELVGLPAVLSLRPRAAPAGHAFDLRLAGSIPPADLVAAAILGPMNRKLGAPCLALGATAGEQVSVVLDGKCRDAGVLSRLETNPPAALYGAPPARQKSVIRNPETLSKLGAAA
jgi:serine/threonine-protein kinase